MSDCKEGRILLKAVMNTANQWGCEWPNSRDVKTVERVTREIARLRKSTHMPGFSLAIEKLAHELIYDLGFRRLYEEDTIAESLLFEVIGTIKGAVHMAAELVME